MCPQPGPLFKTVPYPKCLKGVLDLDDLLDVVGNGGNDLINEMHHAVGRMVVSFQQPGTVNGYNLSEKKQGRSEHPGVQGLPTVCQITRQNTPDGPELGSLWTEDSSG